MAYTPTTWATGDIVTAEKLNKLEQGVADAGGVLVVTATVDSDTGSVTLNKSYNEIKAAILAGQLPVIVDDRSADGEGGGLGVSSVSAVYTDDSAYIVVDMSNMSYQATDPDEPMASGGGSVTPIK